MCLNCVEMYSFLFLVWRPHAHQVNQVIVQLQTNKFLSSGVIIGPIVSAFYVASIATIC